VNELLQAGDCYDAQSARGRCALNVNAAKACGSVRGQTWHCAGVEVIVGIEAAEVSRQGEEQVDVEIRFCALKCKGRRGARVGEWLGTFMVA
jgi:hypothetical protein